MAEMNGYAPPLVNRLLFLVDGQTRVSPNKEDPS